MSQLVLIPGQLTLKSIRAFWQSPQTVIIPAEYYKCIDQSAEAVTNVLANNQTVYGINTGFGLLANTRIEHDKLNELQRSLVLSHATGTGDMLDDECVSLIMLLKINSLARGHSGVRREVIDLLLALLNAQLYPQIPAKGSVGASGDLAPLAHLSGVLLGVGTVSSKEGIISAEEALKRINKKPVELAPKEGLALLNGTQTSTALALCGLFWAENIFAAGMVAGALSIDAAAGSDAPFDARIHDVRGHQGQIDVAKTIRQILSDSQIRASHMHCAKVQDPYSLRCQPQVMGACLDHLKFAANTFLIEANAVSDNPLVFSDTGDIISGGNFHAEPIALSADTLALAIAETGAISERRIALLMDRHISGLPAFLVQEGGVNSGFMIAQVTAAALASENKCLAHPSSVDSLPTSANQEDHVSMATYAARRLKEMAHNSGTIIGIELLAAAQGIDFRSPLETASTLKQVMTIIRQDVPFYSADRYFAPDIENIKSKVMNGTFNMVAQQLNLPSY